MNPCTGCTDLPTQTPTPPFSALLLGRLSSRTLTPWAPFSMASGWAHSTGGGSRVSALESPVIPWLPPSWVCCRLTSFSPKAPGSAPAGALNRLWLLAAVSWYDLYAREVTVSGYSWPWGTLPSLVNFPIPAHTFITALI